MIKKQSKTLIFLLSAAMILVFMPQLVLPSDAAVKPGRVTGLRIVKQTRTSVSLSWTKARAARKYQVSCTSGSSGTGFDYRFRPSVSSSSMASAFFSISSLAFA
ncbi:hypothetical protein [Eubacterium sp. F2]|uniref:hypothetical protein n=1 Tax=Eubacterium sp. F2 TaxID=3381348 RepID=UPI003907F655